MLNEEISSSFYLSNRQQQLKCSRAIKAIIFYKSFSIDLITGKKTNHTSDECLGFFEKFKLEDDYKTPHVFHLFFEFGYIANNLEHLVEESDPLFIFVEYKFGHRENVFSKKSDPIKLESISTLNKDLYFKRFVDVQKHLEAGDCYQLNLTERFYFKFEQKAETILNKLWSNKKLIAPYSHYTYISSLNKLFLSNSPECLFQYRRGDNSLITMPIKGTIRIKSSKQKAWEKLRKSVKDTTELNIITDLMRNDLTKTSLNVSTVISKKSKLEVPGLLHQCSIIQTKLKSSTSLKKIICGLFPGGSITGAPKKRVMELTKKIESGRRGFYTGSTILLYKNIKTASINIRSAEIDLENRELKYGSGGGITLRSKAEEEYSEVYSKLESFLRLLS